MGLAAFTSTTTKSAFIKITFITYAAALSLLVVGCEKESNDEKVVIKVSENITIPTIDDQNISDFTRQFANDYFASLDSLITHFNEAKDSGDTFQFVQYRNSVWTPAFTEKTEFYRNTLEHNKAYLANNAIAPLFEHFEKLIFVGINLKKGLLDKETALIDEALTDASNSKKAVESILSAAGLTHDD